MPCFPLPPRQIPFGILAFQNFSFFLNAYVKEPGMDSSTLRAIVSGNEQTRTQLLPVKKNLRNLHLGRLGPGFRFFKSVTIRSHPRLELPVFSLPFFVLQCVIIIEGREGFLARTFKPRNTPNTRKKTGKSGIPVLTKSPPSVPFAFASHSCISSILVNFPVFFWPSSWSFVAMNSPLRFCGSVPCSRLSPLPPLASVKSTFSAWFDYLVVKIPLSRARQGGTGGGRRIRSDALRSRLCRRRGGKHSTHCHLNDLCKPEP